MPNYYILKSIRSLKEGKIVKCPLLNVIGDRARLGLSAHKGVQCSHNTIQGEEGFRDKKNNTPQQQEKRDVFEVIQELKIA